MSGGAGASYRSVSETPTVACPLKGYNTCMSLTSSVILLVIVVAAIGLLAAAWFIPRKKTPRVRRKQESLDPLSDPPTITHYGHA